MNLKDIRIDGRDGGESSKLIEVIKNLPEGTITGISGYRDVRARYQICIALGEKTVVGIESTGRDKDNLNLNLSRGSINSVRGFSNSFYFEHMGESYVVGPVSNFEISKE